VHVLLTGGGGMLASGIAEAWRSRRPDDELTVLARRDVDLRDAAATRAAIGRAKPDTVIHTAAFVGGIADKTARPLPYLLENIRIDASVLDAVVGEEVPGYLYMASAAVYPASAPNPISESALFSGRLEPANEGYGLAKLTGLTAVGYAARQTGHAYRALLPSNLYGPRDTFDPTRAHLIASTIYKAHKARDARSPHVEVWGDGTARREFTFAPDLAEWVVSEVDRLAEWPAFMNVGAGVDHSIREFYEIACDVVGYGGRLAFDTTKPSGVPQRLIDSALARQHGWNPRTDIRDGMAACYSSFLSQIADGDLR
jgi:GDP-L-fucose synthase